MKKKLLAMLKAKEEKRGVLLTKSDESKDLVEVRSIHLQMQGIDGEITELRSMIDALPAEVAPDGQELRTKLINEQTKQPEKRSFDPATGIEIKTDVNLHQEKRSKEEVNFETREKRGKDLMENRSVTVTTSGIILPQHQASDIRPTFNQVSSLLDRVTIKPLTGGESFKQPYLKGYGTGDYTAEGADYADAEPTFGYAEMNKTKITAYAEDSEELQKLPAADYDGEVMKGITIATRKKTTREILVGDGTTGHLVGIFDDGATAIDAATDLTVATIDNTTLDEIVFSYGGDEDVEDAAVLILNKKDLKGFSRLRTTDGKKFHAIVTNGNTGTIDGTPFIINSACKPISVASTAAGSYCMAYGPLSNYMLCVFSDLDVQRSTDYKFKQGMIAHRGSVFLGGNVVSKNGFLRIKKASNA